MADEEKRDDKLLVLPLGEESKLITQTIANDTARQILELLAEGAMSTSAIAKKLDIPLTTAQYNVEKLIEAGLVVVEKTKYSEKGREVKLYAPARRMIVLVPANTPRQAVMDVLKKYLVLLPIAGVLALLVEVAMDVRNGLFSLGRSSAMKGGENGPLLSQGMTATPTPGVTDTGPLVSGALPSPMPTATPAPAPGPTSTGFWTYVANNTTEALGNLTKGYGNVTDAINGTSGTVRESSGILPPASPPSAAGSALIPPDLLNHYGLWFFVGCLLIIGIMVAYDLYRHRRKKK